MRRIATILSALALVALCAGCGSESGTTTTTNTSVNIAPTPAKSDSSTGAPVGSGPSGAPPNTGGAPTKSPTPPGIKPPT